MATAENILVTIGVATLVITAATMVLYAADLYATWRFRPSAFRRGLVVLSAEQALPNPAGHFAPNETVETVNGVFRFLAPKECLFRAKLHPSASGLNAALPLKGTIVWAGDEAQVTGRLPTFYVAFVGAWIVGLTTYWLVILEDIVRRAEADFLAFVPDLVLVGIALLSCLALLGVIAKYGAAFWADRTRSLVSELEAVLRATEAQRRVELREPLRG